MLTIDNQLTATNEFKAPILLVEDSPDLRDLMSLALSGAGFSVRTAANGQVALDMLKDGLLPSLVLLDRYMDVMNGETFLELGQSSLPELFTDLPVVMITGSDDFSSARPVVRTIRKPIDLDVLLGVAREFAG